MTLSTADLAKLRASAQREIDLHDYPGAKPVAFVPAHDLIELLDRVVTCEADMLAGEDTSPGKKHPVRDGE